MNRRPRPHAPKPHRHREEAKHARVAGLPAVAALFTASPERIEKLYFLDAVKREVSAICLLILLIVVAIDLLSARVRHRLIGAL